MGYCIFQYNHKKCTISFTIFVPMSRANFYFLVFPDYFNDICIIFSGRVYNLVKITKGSIVRICWSN